MHLLLLLSLINLPVGEARLNGLADAAVTITDQAAALYVNPALLTKTTDRKLLFNPIGFPLGREGDLALRIFESYTQIGYVGYSQPIGEVGTGIAGYQDEGGGRGLLIGAGYKFGFLHAGISAGIRYHPYDDPNFRPAFGIGLAILGIKFAEVPGEVSVAAALRRIEYLNIQGGLDYRIEFFRILANFNFRNPFQDQSQATANLAALFSFKDILDLPLEIGGGWGSDNRYGVLLAADLSLCQINLSYSNIPQLYYQPQGRIAFSLLFNVASTKEVEERLASIESEQEKKNRIISRTWTSQGIDAYNSQNLNEALHAFDVALIWDPSNKDALNWLERVREEKTSSEFNALLAAARAAISTKNYLEAWNRAETALAIDSTNAEAKSLVSEAKRNYMQETSSQTASARNAGELNALYLKASEQYASGDYAAAAETWNKIAKLEPKSKTLQTYQRQTSEKIAEQVAAGMRELGELEKKGRWRDALDLARRIQRLAPGNQEITAKVNTYQSKIKSLVSQYETQGIDYYNRGSYVNAQNSFSALLTLDPANTTGKQYLERIKGKLQTKDTDQLYMQGVQAYTENRYDEAIRYWEQVLAINPNYQNAARNIQRAREKLAQLK